MKVEHVTFEEDGAATIFIPRSKSDVAGDGRIAYLSPVTAACFPVGLTPQGFERSTFPSPSP